MSTATISIDNLDQLVVGRQDLAAANAITQDIMVRNTDANGIIKMKLGGNSNGGTFNIRNSNINSKFKVRGNGETVPEKSFSGIIDPTVSAGNRGDIQFGAVSDDGSEESILIRLHYDVSAPLLQTKGQMIDWKKTVIINDSSAVQYTASALISGNIARDVDGATRADTFPNADDLVAGINDVKVGTTFDVTIKNTETRSQGNIANVIDIQNGVSMTWNTTNTPSFRYIDPQSSRTFRIRITNVTSLSEAYTVYHLASHNILEADGFSLTWKETVGDGADIALLTTRQDLPKLLIASILTTASRTNTLLTSFEVTTGGANEGIKYIGRKKVKVEVTCRIYCQIWDLNDEMITYIAINKDGVDVTPAATTKIESFPCAQVTVSTILEDPLDFGEVISATIKADQNNSVVVFSSALSVQVIS